MEKFRLNVFGMKLFTVIINENPYSQCHRCANLKKGELEDFEGYNCVASREVVWHGVDIIDAAKNSISNCDGFKSG